MKPWFILIGLAVAITASVTIALPLLKVSSVERGPSLPAPVVAEGPAPIAMVEGDTTYNFGVLPQEFTSNHSWTIKNTGAGILELKGTATTCSCTTADLFEEKSKGGEKVGKTATLKPGESRTVGVTFMTRTWNNYDQKVTIATNDPTHPQIVLKLEGVVRPAITTIPADPSINFLSVSNEDPTIRRLFLYSADRPDLKLIRLVNTKPELLGVESRAMTPEELAGFKVQKGFAIEVTVKPSMVLGDFAEEIMVETDHPLKNDLKIRLVGRVTGPISALPDKVTMRDATSSNGGSTLLSLWARGRTSVNFVIDHKPKGMDVVIEPYPAVAGLKGSKYKMTVKLIPGIESGRITDEIVLKTDDPKVNELRIPVDVLVQGAR